MVNQQEQNIVDYKKIGQRILKLRKERGFYQEQLSGLIGISRQFLGYIEHGERKVSVEVLARICKALDADMHYIVFGHPNGCNANSELLCELRELVQRY